MRRLQRPLLLAIAVLAGLLAGLRGASAAPALDSVGPPEATCTLVATTRTCDLYASAGTLALPGGATATIWGYSDQPNGAAQLPGPTLAANQGETVVVVLHNALAEPTSLSFPALALRPDRQGAAPNATASYTFSAAQPGTFLYEAGPTANGPRQVAMGLFGALVVRPSPAATAYGTPASAYDDEAVLIYSEVDTNLNANPTGFRMQGFNPQFHLINGKAYPATAAIPSAPGHRLLLRQLNASLRHRSISLLGLRQTVLANDGAPLTYPYGVVSETIGAGATLDTLVAIPANAPADARYPLYDAALPMGGPGGPNALGGILSFVSLAPVAPGPDTVGPTTSGVAITPPSGGSATLSASVSDASSGGSNIAAAEYFVDSTGANGSGTAMAATDGVFDAPSEGVSASVNTAALASGTHIFYVHGQDSAGNWGAVSSVTLKSDTAGPATSALTLNPATANGGAAVAIAASASDSATGGSNIAAAEYTIDGGAPAALTPNTTSQPVASLSGSIPAATVNALTSGNHTIAARARDAVGNWGAFATATLKIDKAGPAGSVVSMAPNPNNGTLAYNSLTNGVRVDATFSDAASGNTALTAAEAFIDATGANGSGIAFIATDGVFNAPAEAAYAVLPLSQVQVLAAGSHTVSIHARDAAGNWGAFATTALVIDKTGPTTSGANVTPNPVTTLAGSTTLNATTSDASSGGSTIVAAEYYIGADPGKGLATAMTAADGSFNSSSEAVRATIAVSNRTTGAYTVNVRAKDAAGNWGATTSTTFNVVDQLFADSFEAQNASAWTTTTGAASLSFPTAAKMGSGGTYGMRAAISAGASGNVASTLTANQSSYRARFYINPNSVALNGTTPIDVFSALDGSATPRTVFSVQLRRSNGAYQVRGVVFTGTGATNSTTNWYTITGATAVELSWSSANASSFSISTAGTLRQTLANLNTSGFTVRTARLGPQGTLAGVSGAIYLDAFVSTRNTPIGQ